MKYFFRIFIFLLGTTSFAQNTIPNVLKKLNKESVPYITVAEVKNDTNYIFVDAREPKEYETSHIKDAIFVGFNHFEGKEFLTTIPDKNSRIVVYCSVGFRSEIIGEKLLKLGYKNVLNLYGGIFDWKNSGGKVYSDVGVETENVHTYNKRWSRYLDKGVKVY